MTSTPDPAYFVELLGRVIASIKHGQPEDCPCCYVAGAMLDPAEHLETCPFWEADEMLFVPVPLLRRPAP